MSVFRFLSISLVCLRVSMSEKKIINVKNNNALEANTYLIIPSGIFGFRFSEQTNRFFCPLSSHVLSARRHVIRSFVTIHRPPLTVNKPVDPKVHSPPAVGRHTGRTVSLMEAGRSSRSSAMSLANRNGWKCEWNSTRDTPRA